MDSNEFLSTLALTFVQGVGPKTAKLLIAHCGSASEVWKRNIGQIQKIPDIGPKTAHEIASSRESAFKRAEQECELAQKKDIRILLYNDTDFPNRLKVLPDSPLLLYLRGSGTLNMPKAIGIVGTRRASLYGKAITEKIVEDVAHFYPTIVSGLAYGIDIQAHITAIAQKIPTVAVLASGVDVIYPSAHLPQVDAMLELGLVISEKALGTQPDAMLFPARNRIIAGLSDALVVVEAAAKGGALITANIAHSYDKEIFAVPGNLSSLTSAGCNKLIQSQKASIYMNVQDLESSLRWDMSHTELRPSRRAPQEIPKLEGVEQRIYNILAEKGKLQIDDLAVYAQIPIGAAAANLFELELKNIVKALPGKQYELS